MTLVLTDNRHASATRNRVRRVKIDIEGLVQGVGFRPFVSRLADRLKLSGCVANAAHGVTIEIEGTKAAIQRFNDTLKNEIPTLARIDHIHQEELPTRGDRDFTIATSQPGNLQTSVILPDVATCTECLAEIMDKDNRRYAYPFTNCTNCGPRFSILESLPFDRINTTMRTFVMCRECQSEYDSASDRRYHAQANACPNCGPQLSLLDNNGQTVATRHQALLAAAEALRAGKIVALKGIGGFQLLVDARNNATVLTLRQRKSRPDKPFALMFPTAKMANDYCDINQQEHELLTGPAAPIVLLKSRRSSEEIPPLSETIAPGNPCYGVMLPCSPLHHLLMHELGFPIVATSGNISGDPIAIDETDAVNRLQGIADTYLVHDRPIVIPLDDSVVQVVAMRTSILRRARGLAPFSLPLAHTGPTVLALGGHLKSTVALTVDKQVIISPHIGNLDNACARQQYHVTINHLQALYNCKPSIVSCDQHPDYYSSQYARKLGLTLMPVQHHVAHILACMAENSIDEPVLGVAWDGSGYGTRDTLWGGEFFIINGLNVNRVASLRPFALPGGDKAVIEPRRAALGLLYELLGDEAFTDNSLAPLRSFSLQEQKLLRRMLARKLNAPLTSSIGRLFDAVAALTGLMQTTSFEGQAAMALEYAINQQESDGDYCFDLKQSKTTDTVTIDWQPLLIDLLQDLKAGCATSVVASRFHNALINMVLAVANQFSIRHIVLSGGCFQNRFLTENTVNILKQAHFRPYWHQQLPANDGGLALGQAAWTIKQIEAGLN